MVVLTIDFCFDSVLFLRGCLGGVLLKGLFNTELLRLLPTTAWSTDAPKLL